MAERPARKPRKPYSAQVVRTERLTPHMQRVVLGGEGLADFSADTCTDHYVKLLFAPEGVTYPEPFDLERIREELPREQWPVTRTYTVRALGRRAPRADPGLRASTATRAWPGPWAMRVRPGETVRFMGPGGAYAPDPDGRLASARRRRERAARDRPLPGDAARRRHARTPSWRSPAPRRSRRSTPMWRSSGCTAATVRSARPWSRPYARWSSPRAARTRSCTARRHFVKELRRLLRVERGSRREDLSISGYWRLGHDEDGWQASKREWNARIEAEQEGAGGRPGSHLPARMPGYLRVRMPC